jgi:hypothetical protein
MQMLIRVVPNKIGSVWEVVKPAVIRADGIEEKYAQAHLNKLLHDLLSSKAMLYLGLDTKQTEIKTVLIAKLMFNETKKQKYLLIQTYYAFSKSNESEWNANVKFALEFAQKEKCEYIAVDSNNPKIMSLLKSRGFSEKYKRIELNIGGV